MTVLRRMRIGYVGIVVYLVILAGAGVFSALMVRSWASDFNGTLARTHASSTISEASANMVIYGVGAATATDEANRSEEDSVRAQDRGEVEEALATLVSTEQVSA